MTTLGSSAKGRRSDLPSASELVRLKESGLTWVQLGERFGRSPDTIRYRITVSGLMAPRPRRTEPSLAALVDIREEEWMDRGLCSQTDPEKFFPDTGEHSTDAKKTCRRCTVRAECLEYALRNDEEWGVWGGLTANERRALKRKAKQARRDSAA